MSDNPRVHFILTMPVKREKRVGIYCRVSSNSADQLNRLTAQYSTDKIDSCCTSGLLVDVYMDIASSKTGVCVK